MPNDNESAFSLVLTDPAAWCQMGDRMMTAARLLWTASLANDDLLKPSLAGAPEFQARMDLLWPAALVLGFSAENFVKAAHIKTLGLGNSGQPERRLPKPLSRHDLAVIAKDTGLPFTERELELLKRMTSIVKWAGRYPVPNKSEEPLNLTIMHSDDLATLALIRARVFAFLGLKAT